MEWLLAIYVVGAIITMGFALASEIKSEKEIYFTNLLLCGLIWPVLWVGVVAYAFWDRD